MTTKRNVAFSDIIPQKHRFFKYPAEEILGFCVSFSEIIKKRRDISVSCLSDLQGSKNPLRLMAQWVGLYLAAAFFWLRRYSSSVAKPSLVIMPGVSMVQ